MMNEEEKSSIYNIEDLIKSYIKNIDNYNDNFTEVFKIWLKEKKFIDNDINITISNSLNKILRLYLNEFTKEGDTIILGKPCDFNILDIFKEYDLNIIFIDIDNDGIKIEEVDNILKNKSFNLNLNSNIILYLMPFFNKPCTRSLSNNRKLILNNICNNYNNFWVISNETLRLSFWDKVSYNDDYYKSLSKLNDRIVSISCIDDKIKLYWLNSKNNSLIDDLNHDNVCNLSVIEEMVYCKLINDKELINYLTKKYSEYKLKYDRIVKKLNDFDIKFNKKQGGDNLINISFDLIIPIKKLNETDFKNHNFESLIIYKENFDYNLNYVSVDFVNFTESQVIRDLNTLNGIVKMIKLYRMGIYTDDNDFLYNLSNKIVNDKKLYHYQTIKDDFKLNNLIEGIVCNASSEKTNLFLESLIKDNSNIPLVLVNKKNINQKLLFNYIKNGSISIVDELYEGNIILNKIKNFVENNCEGWKFEDNVLKSLNESIKLDYNKNKESEFDCVIKHINFLKNNNDDQFKCFKDFVEYKLQVKKDKLFINSGNCKMVFYSVYNLNLVVFENMEDRENILKSFRSIYENINYMIFVSSSAGVYGDLSFEYDIYENDLKLEYFKPISAFCVGKYLNDNYYLKDDTISCNDFESDYEIQENGLVKISLPDAIDFDLNNFSENLKSKLNDLQMINVEDIRMYTVGIIDIVVELENSPFIIPDDSIRILSEIIMEEYYNESEVLFRSKLNISFMLYETNSNGLNSVSVRTINEMKEELIFDGISCLSCFEFYKSCYENNLDNLSLDIYLKDKTKIKIEYYDSNFYMSSDVKILDLNNF